MVVDSSWVPVLTVKCLQSDNKPFYCSNFGRISLLSYFSLVFLANWSEFLLLGILLGLSLFSCSRVFL
jgi:hypothetical protein